MGTKIIAILIVAILAIVVAVEFDYASGAADKRHRDAEFRRLDAEHWQRFGV